MEPERARRTPGAGSELVTVQAHAFAATFRLRELVPIFGAAEVQIEHDLLTARFSDGMVALGLDFGALVFFGGSDARRQEVMRATAAALGEKSLPRTEDFVVEVAPGARPEVRFDRIVVPELSPPVREIIGLLLAQSAAMDYYEEDVGGILAHTERITRKIGQGGRTGVPVKELTRFIGHCIQTKNEVIETLALFDKPAVTWEDESLDRLFTRLREMLEIGDRFRALEYRLRTIQDSLVLLVDLSRGSSTFRLEIMVAVLILTELVVMIWQTLRPGGH